MHDQSLVLMRSLILISCLLASTAFGVETKWREGDLVGYPALFDDDGARIGGGQFSQRVHGKTMEVTSSYVFKDGRTAIEKATFELQPQLAQKKWSFEEKRGDAILRHYEIDFDAGVAKGEKHEGSKVKRYDEKLKVQPGKTFAGLGFVFATKNLAKELESGPVELQAVAFTPKPRQVTVKLRRDGDETLTSGTNSVPAVRIVIEPQIPAIARPFVHPKPAVMWFARNSPPQFLRSSATLAEPEEELVQINLFGSSSRIGRSQAPKRP